MPKPPVDYNSDTPWPYYPMILKTSSSHKEGCNRRWLLDTKRFIGENGIVKKVEVVEVEWEKDEAGHPQLKRTNRSEIIEADLVLLAMGFVHPVYEGLLEELGVKLDARKNVEVVDGKSSVDKVFAAGDSAFGASLVVKAIASGRKTASKIDEYVKNIK